MLTRKIAARIADDAASKIPTTPKEPKPSE